MDDKSNLSEYEKAILDVDKSIKKIEEAVESSKRMKRLLAIDDFQVAIMENLLTRDKESAVDKLVHEINLDEHQEKMILSELRMLKRVEKYICATADNLEAREAKLRKEKEYRVQLIKENKENQKPNRQER